MGTVISLIETMANFWVQELKVVQLLYNDRDLCIPHLFSYEMHIHNDQVLLIRFDSVI